MIRKRWIGIPRHQYSREYFLSDRCEGFAEYRSGARVSRVKERLLEKVAPKSGERVLEIGCGRGELLRMCASRGARAVGVDYAIEAARLTHETCGPAASVAQADAVALPFADGSFEKVFLGDVVEHLTEEQARRMLAEANRVLEPGGRLVLHTSPNVLFIRLVFPWALLALLLAGRVSLVKLFADQYRTIREFHVREYSLGRLRRLFRSSPFDEFRVECDPDLLRGGESRYTSSLAASPLVRSIARIASREPFVRIFANDLWAIAEKR